MATLEYLHFNIKLSARRADHRDTVAFYFNACSQLKDFD